MLRKPTWLLDHRRDVYSQTGEDGIIEAILETIGERNRWCVEFGAWDGQHLSNTRNLIESRGYNAVLIEGDKRRFDALSKFHSGNRMVFPINAFVGFNGKNSLDTILKTTPIPPDFDFLSIDIDGNDFHVWEALSDYRPKLVCVEFNPTIPTDCEFVQKPEADLNVGSSISAFVSLAKRKGYSLACALSFNAFFVRDDLFSRLEIADNSVHILRTELGSVTHVFQGFNGQIFIMGSRQMPWHGLRLEDRDFQILPTALQKFPAAYNAIELQMFNLLKSWRRLKRKYSGGNH